MGILYFLGIKHCYNFIFCFILTVHGGIRHLEIKDTFTRIAENVHGGIRHLEKLGRLRISVMLVHGGIRHLET